MYALNGRPRTSVVVLLSILMGLVLIGVTSSVVIVRNEGLEGLFNRKRKAVEAVAPETLPVLDEVEDRVLDGQKEGHKSDRPRSNR